MSDRIKKASRKKNYLFNEFSDYWHFARYLTTNQKDAIMQALSKNEVAIIQESYRQGQWVDLIIRDELDSLVDEIQLKHNINLIEIRCKVLKGYSVYVSKELWDEVIFRLKDIDEIKKRYLVGGLAASMCKINNDVVFLSRKGSSVEE